MDNINYDFTGLKAVFINCTLKKSPEITNTQGLMEVSGKIMQNHGVEVEYIRAVDFEIPVGVYPDMTEHGYEKDDWVKIQK